MGVNLCRVKLSVVVNILHCLWKWILSYINAKTTPADKMFNTDHANNSFTTAVRHRTEKFRFHFALKSRWIYKETIVSWGNISPVDLGQELIEVLVSPICCCCSFFSIAKDNSQTSLNYLTVSIFHLFSRDPRLTNWTRATISSLFDKKNTQ